MKVLIFATRFFSKCSEERVRSFKNDLYKRVKLYLSKLFNVEMDNIYIYKDIEGICIDENHIIGVIKIDKIELRGDKNKDITDVALPKLLKYLQSSFIWVQEVTLDKALFTVFALGILGSLKKEIEEIKRILNDIRSNIKK